VIFVNRYDPTDLKSPSSNIAIKKIYCGGNHNFLKTQDDKFYSFGHNVNGQLGLGDDENRESPTEFSIKITNEEVSKAWDSLKKDDCDFSFMMLTYSDDGKELVLVKTGDKGIKGFVESLKEDQIFFFGLVKCLAVDEESKRTKFILVTWVGAKVKVTARAKVSTHKSVVQDFFKGHHVGVHVTELKELAKEELIKSLNKATGSHKPKYYDFLDGESSEEKEESNE